jgi:hypothetical protein
MISQEVKSPFDFVNDISFNKLNIMLEDNMYLYNCWVTNRSFSLHLDSLFFANEMNFYHELPKDMQFSFYLSTLRPRKRFAKWPKKDQTEEIALVQKALNCNWRRAAETLAILTPEDLEVLKQEQEQGGVSGRSTE